MDMAVLAAQELQGIVSRAALQSPEAAQQLPEEVFWFARPPKDLLKWNLLSPGAFPWLKPFLRRQAQSLHLSECFCVKAAVERCCLPQCVQLFTVSVLPMMSKFSVTTYRKSSYVLHMLCT